MNRGILIIVLAIALSIVVHLIQTFDGLGQTEDENDVISIGGGNSGADSNSEEEAVVQEDYKIIESDYIHWDHMPLVYRYKNIGKCTKESVNSMEEALVILEQRTEGAVSFKEYNGQ